MVDLKLWNYSAEEMFLTIMYSPHVEQGRPHESVTVLSCQSAQVFSEVELTEGVGSYRLAVNFSSSVLSTKCLYWDATADEIETALELLRNVDSVRVEKEGSGTETDK